MPSNVTRDRVTSNPVDNDWLSRVKAKLGGRGGKCFCPVHENPNTSTPSLSVSVGADGKPLLYCHGGCSQEQLVEKFKSMDLWPVGRTAKAPRDSERNTPSADEVYDRAWEENEGDQRKVNRELLATYLAGRGITTVPRDAMLLSASAAKRLRLWYGYPCMVVPVVDAIDNLRAVHITYLESDCSAKAAVEKQRQRIGTGDGFFALLKAAKRDRPLVIGEGIETTLSAAQIAGGLPCIAALSTGNMKKL
jgi:phage/plasmid primase-like uncharacterized protein